MMTLGWIPCLLPNLLPPQFSPNFAPSLLCLAHQELFIQRRLPNLLSLLILYSSFSFCNYDDGFANKAANDGARLVKGHTRGRMLKQVGEHLRSLGW